MRKFTDCTSPRTARHRAAICTRVSTAEQVKGTSLDTQMDECRDYATNRRLTVVAEYVDGGVTGKYANRPGLDRLMADCRAGLIEVVIVAKHDRFGRSFRHTVALIGELEELGIEFVSIAERIDDTPSGRFQRNVLLSVAEFERERILERTGEGKERRAVEGRWSCGQPPYGWLLQRDEHGVSQVQINQAEADTWQHIAEGMIDRGLSTLAMARELNAGGIPKRKGGTWTAGSLRHLIQEAHALDGNWVYRRDGRPWAKPSDGPPIAMSLPPILTPERFAALRTVIARQNLTRKPINTIHLLSGRLTSACGSPMWAMKNKPGSRRFYRCRAKFAPDGGGRAKTWNCGCQNIDAQAIEEHVWAAVAQALLDPTALLALAAEQAASAAVATGISQEDIAALDRKIARLQKAASTALADALAHGIDMAVAAGAVRSLQSQLEEAQERRKLVAAWAATSEERSGRAKTLAQIATETTQAISLQSFGDAHRRVIDALDVRIEVSSWNTCSQCNGSGRATGKGRGRICEACHGHGHHPELQIRGHLPLLGATDRPWPVAIEATSA